MPSNNPLKRPDKIVPNTQKQEFTDQIGTLFSQWGQPIYAFIPPIKNFWNKIFHGHNQSTSVEQSEEGQTEISVENQTAINDTKSSQVSETSETSGDQGVSARSEPQHTGPTQTSSTEQETDANSTTQSNLGSPHRETHNQHDPMHSPVQSEDVILQFNTEAHSVNTAQDTNFVSTQGAEHGSADSATTSEPQPEMVPQPMISVDESVKSLRSVADMHDYFSESFEFGGTLYDGKSVNSTFNLSIAEEGVDTGLTDVHGNSIGLYSVGTQKIEGRADGADGPLIFKITLNKNSGNLSLKLNKALSHPDQQDSNDEISLNANDLVQVIRNYTVELSGGDDISGSTALDVGSSFIFKDSGPEVHVSATAPRSLTVDETKLSKDGTAQFKHSFKVSKQLGADQQESLTKEYSLSLSQDGIDSGLTATSDGQSIHLFQNGDTIEGRTESSLVFVMTVNNNGAVKLDQKQGIKHADSSDPNDVAKFSSNDPNNNPVEEMVQLSLKVTLTDKDGDTAVSSDILNIGNAISFKDSAPTMKFNAKKLRTFEKLKITDDSDDHSASADYSDNFRSTIKYGADGKGDLSSEYDLSIINEGIDTGLVDLLSNEAVLLYSVGDHVEGRADNQTVFTLTVNADGIVTLTQARPLQHDTNKPLKLGSGSAVILTRTDTATDGDGDQVTKSDSINIKNKIQFADPSFDTLPTDHFNHMIIDAAQDGIVSQEHGRMVSLGSLEDGHANYLLPLYAPIGSSVITPLTSVLQMQLEQSSDPTATLDALNEALGLPKGTDITHLNPIEMAESGDISALYQAASIMTLTTQLGAATAGILDISDVMVAHEIYEAIGQEISTLPPGTVADFSEEGLLHQIINNVSDQFGIDAEQFEPIVGLMLNSQNNLIDAATEQTDPIESLESAQYITEGAQSASISHLYSPDAGSDFSFTLNHTVFEDNVLDHVDMVPNEATLTEISFETDNAMDYIATENLSQASADADGTTVHVALPTDGSAISFETPAGATMTIDNSGSFSYDTTQVHTDAVDNFSYTFQINDTHQMKTSFMEINVIDQNKAFANLEGGVGDDILSSSDQDADVVALQGHGGNNQYVVDISEINPPEKVMIMDLGITKQNVLSFTGISDENEDGELTLSDAVDSFHQDQPNGDVTLNLTNDSTLVLHNIGTVQGSDVQALEQHLQHVAQEVNIS